jgi:hypothetical protein
MTLGRSGFEPGPSRGEMTEPSGKPPTEPYGGQLYCPVTGMKLGLRQPAVPVQTTIGQGQLSFLDKLFGKKPTPGAVIYVCCPHCAEQVRQNPSSYLYQVIADKGSLSFSYAQAPDKRPVRPPEKQPAQPTGK